MDKSKLESLLSNFQNTHRELLVRLEAIPNLHSEINDLEKSIQGRLKKNENDITYIENLIKSGE